MSRQRLRPSQIITTFGPGAIVDLPDDSVMIAGTEHWFDTDRWKPHRRLSEPRLEAFLNVNHFKTPPAGSMRGYDVPYVRFPKWRVCRRCNHLSNRYKFPQAGTSEKMVPQCLKCGGETYPSRIIVACTQGHIDDFPWYRWVHMGANCDGGQLFLKGDGESAALGDLKVECSCGRNRSLGGALRRDAMASCGVRCSLKRPWLNEEQDPTDCGTVNARLYALQRGASNIYFSVVRSAISIPPWSDPLQMKVSSRWAAAFPEGSPPSDSWNLLIQNMFPQDPLAKVRECIERHLGLRTGRPSIRQEEYLVLEGIRSERVEPNFEARRREISRYTNKFIDQLVAIPRLREIRALVNFTRIEAAAADPTMEIFNEDQPLSVNAAPISAAPQDWLPAVENLGEGFFLRLNPQRLDRWEQETAVKEKSGLLLRAYSEWRQSFGRQPLTQFHPRLILLHTLAHLLMREISLNCGYSSASLRERIYSDGSMAGLLIFTSSPDSDGSLGGLVRLVSTPDRFEAILRSAVKGSMVCSGDPLCMEHDPRKTGRLNGAACHACSMVSETSCEFGNRLLDRSLAVRTNLTNMGYFDYDE